MENEFESMESLSPEFEPQDNTAEQALPRYTPELDDGQSEVQPIPTKERKKVEWTTGKIVALALCCSLVGGILGAGFAMGLPQSQPLQGNNVSNTLEGQRENSVIGTVQVDTSKQMTPAQVYAANVNSTVGITTSVTTNYWGYQTTSPASGSGFIYSDDGYILTNYHVVESASSITVTTYSGTRHNATLVGYDASNDIAVLKIDAEGLTPVITGDSDNMNVGDSVIAIGNPLGELTFSLTCGVVSALDREVTTSSGITMNLIQTDCAINSGNSGGALFNLYGEVIGITNAKYSSSSSYEASIDNIGFAIPFNNVRQIVASIIEKGYITKPYVGISVADVSADTQSYGLPAGAAVKVVTEGSPAAEAGLRINDIITEINGTTITGSSQLVNMVGESNIGDVLHMTVFRQGATITIDVTVGEKIQSATEQEQPTQNQQSGSIPFPNWGGIFGGW